MAGKTLVAGELYESITGQLFEIGRQLRQPSGYPFDPERLKKHLQEAIVGSFSGSSGFRFDKSKDGWTLVEDEGSQLSVSGLEIVSFLKKVESSVSGESMRERAKELGANFGQRQAEYLLDHQAEIPAKWRDYYLVFPGTLWRASCGGLGVPCLAWLSGRWCLLFGWLDGGWGSRVRVLRLCQ